MIEAQVAELPDLDIVNVAAGRGPGQVELMLGAARHEVRDEVQRILAHAQLHPPLVNRRRDGRHPFPHLIRLTPVTADGRQVVGEPVVVVGRHLSVRGLDFYHFAPLAHQYVVASFDRGDGGQLHVLVALRWCRFNHLGWYENGGRFVQKLAKLPENSTA